MATEGLSVRETERLAGAAKAPNGKGRKPPAAKSTDTLALERRLGLVLGLAVKIEEQGETGRLILAYKSLEQLDTVAMTELILDRLRRTPSNQAFLRSIVKSSEEDAE